MKLYNTLSRQLDDINPLQPPTVSVYSCGPTVYDYAHIGHWFTYVRIDTLIRGLKSSGLEPNWVMNITDVGHLTSDADEGEDKLEKGAKREGKTAWEVAEFYTQDFLECMNLLNMLQPTNIVKATDHIAEQLALIQTLEAKGFTYVIDDGVYYDTSKFPQYADFAQLDLDEQQAGARVNINDQKRNQSDFALWKFSPSGEKRDMEWESPWGKGFPGWHIECSAMSMKYLGDTLDIHTGGIDHIPVHHSNEIAQSEAATGKRFANTWLHSNHVTVNGEKISKSLGNGIRLQEIIEKGIPAEAVRLHVLESHYRSQSKFSWESLEAAHNRLRGLQAMADLQWQTVTEGLVFDYQSAGTSLRQALTNDLDTPSLLAQLSDIEGQIVNGLVSTADRQQFHDLLATIEELTGLTLAPRVDINDEQRSLIAEREVARHAQNWSQSDQLRDQLVAEGIGLRDTPTGAIWFRL